MVSITAMSPIVFYISEVGKNIDPFKKALAHSGYKCHNIPIANFSNQGSMLPDLSLDLALKPLNQDWVAMLVWL